MDDDSCRSHTSTTQDESFTNMHCFDFTAGLEVQVHKQKNHPAHRILKANGYVQSVMQNQLTTQDFVAKAHPSSSSPLTVCFW